MDLDRQLTVGILAHVDAGKTTLSESVLHESGMLRQVGRVDHQNTFLDNNEMERARGITIFSKQAIFTWGDCRITLLDTPGHIDFSAEMERSLAVLDYAILLICASDLVQSHTMTLWRLLETYQIPTFIFVNKMDLAVLNQEEMIADIKDHLEGNVVDFTRLYDLEKAPESALEHLAVCSDALMEEYLDGGSCSLHQVKEAIFRRQLFPCLFGVALQGQGVRALLDCLVKYEKNPVYGTEFGARVFKIERDEKGNRLTYLKITGGRLQVKDVLTKEQEKVNQIRLYSGTKYETVGQAEGGTVCAVTGLNKTYPGMGMGFESTLCSPSLLPVLTYRLLLPEGSDPAKALLDLRQLEEEDPLLKIKWQEASGEIQVQLMGEIQLEILAARLQERFGLKVAFDLGQILYRETIKEPVMGIGHFEPLRHYAEVQLLLEPLKAGAGLVFACDCHVDDLASNWQNLVLTHLVEREHLGVLTGSPITDMKITLLNGRAHNKHTEGGDFRQATYRAVRQGLKRAESVLLEPMYAFTLEVPTENIGRGMADIQRFCGEFSAPEQKGNRMKLKGIAPVATMNGYQNEVLSYTGGLGRLFCRSGGYAPCHNAEDVIAKIAYDSEQDRENPTSSVFCTHGAGFVVPWDLVEEYMHLEVNQKGAVAEKSQVGTLDNPTARCSRSFSYELTQEELDAIYVKTPDPVKKPQRAITISADEMDGVKRKSKPKKKQKEYLLVDGYNIIFGWDDLKELAELNIDSARHKLMDILCNYQGMVGCILIVVFDAYKVVGNSGQYLDYHNIHVVYTKEAETADAYIEKTVREIAKAHIVTVATSDAMEQLIIMGQGAMRLSAKGLRKEIEEAAKELRKNHFKGVGEKRNYLFHYLSEEIAVEMERIRLGKRK